MKQISPLGSVVLLSVTLVFSVLFPEVVRGESQGVVQQSAPRAAPALPSAQAPPQAPAATIPNEKVQVEQYQQQYWKSGKDRDRNVVQYKLYPREGRVQLGLEYGFASGDPFLKIRGLGGYLGYNFTEYWAINLLYFKWTTGYSSAHSAFVTAAGVGTNSDPLKSFMGAEVSWNLLYGKLSLLGAGITHFDLMASLGGGVMDTDNGKGMSGLFGLGQQFYLNQTFSLKIDYRGYVFREKLIEKVGTTVAVGTDLGTSWSWLHSITFGAVAMF